MLKPVIAATALLTIAGSSYVYAQQRYDGPQGFRDGGPRVEYRHRLSAEDVSAFADARIAALKAGLELTADQQKSWPAFETALRNMVTLRVDRLKARQAAEQQGQPQSQPMSPFDRLQRRADNMSKASAALKQIADAGAPLYASLDDSQKARFTILAHMLRPHPRWRDGSNFDRDGRGEGPRWGRDGSRFGDNDGSNGGMHRMMDNNDDQDSHL
jgi:zinc resistance-associated protein